MKSKTLLSILALFLFFLLLCLGMWQLHRAEKKRLLLNNFYTRVNAHPLDIKDLDKENSSLSNLRYFPIALEGYYDNAHVFLLDNKFYKHQPGYEVLTPFLSNRSNQPILINRGWLPRNYNDFKKLPIIPKITGQQIVRGVLYVPLQKPFLLKKPPLLNEQNWPLIVQALQFDYFALQLNKNIYPAIIWLDKADKNGFARDWQPVFMKPAQHIAYAFQWFFLALTILLIYIGLMLKAIKEKKKNVSFCK